MINFNFLGYFVTGAKDFYNLSFFEVSAYSGKSFFWKAALSSTLIF